MGSTFVDVEFCWVNEETYEIVDAVIKVKDKTHKVTSFYRPTSKLMLDCDTAFFKMFNSIFDSCTILNDFKNDFFQLLEMQLEFFLRYFFLSLLWFTSWFSYEENLFIRNM